MTNLEQKKGVSFSRELVERARFELTSGAILSNHASKITNFTFILGDTPATLIKKANVLFYLLALQVHNLNVVA